MNNSILNFLRRFPHQHYNARQIAHHLKLDSSQYKSLRTELKALVREGKIILHPDERYSCRDVNKILKGTLKLHSEGYGFLLPESKKKADVFIPKRYTNYAMSGDLVLVESTRSPKDGRYEGRVVQILKRASQMIVGTVQKKGRHHYVSCREQGDEFLVYVPQKHLNKAAENDLVAVNLVQYPGPGVTAVGEVSQILGGGESLEGLVEGILLQKDIRRSFPQVVMKEVEGFSDDILASVDFKKRYDLRDLPFMTIDGITAKDFDDAVCCVRKGQATILYVSIADVADYVKKDSDLDQEAYRRSTSVYLPNECIPMLPERLSNDLCSLNPHIPRLTLTAEIHFNTNGEFLRAHFYESVIKSHKRATYEEVQAYFDDGSDGAFDPELEKSLTLMKSLAHQLMDQAKARGILGFDLPEAEVIFDAHGKIQNIQKAQRFFSHKLIEVFMIAANVAVAQYFTVMGLPLVYRVHDKPDDMKIQNFFEVVNNLGLSRQLQGFHPGDFFESLKGHPKETFLQTVFLRSLKQAIYDSQNIGHYGLALEDYAHFTSPIRRYPDLLVHRQIKALSQKDPEGLLTLKKAHLKSSAKNAKQKLPYDFMALRTMAQHCSRRERDAVEVEREVLSLRQAQFMKDHVHEKFFGRVNRIAKFGVFIELEPYFVEALLPLKSLQDDYYQFDDKRLVLVGRRTKQTIKMGDRLWVIVVDADMEKGEIILEPAPTKRPPHKKNNNKEAKSSHKKGRHRRQGKKRGRR